MKQIKLYGGGMHGQTVSWNGSAPSIVAPERRFNHVDPWAFDPGKPIYHPMEIETYQIDMWQERRRNGFRRMRVGLLEGRQLHHHEEWDVQRDLGSVPWQPIDPPSILKDFDRWFAWCAYKHTQDTAHIREEIGRW